MELIYSAKEATPYYWVDSHHHPHDKWHVEIITAAISRQLEKLASAGEKTRCYQRLDEYNWAGFIKGYHYGSYEMTICTRHFIEFTRTQNAGLTPTKISIHHTMAAAIVSEK